MRKEFREISEWQKRPGARKRDGIFVVEGIRMCEEIPLERLYRAVMTESFCKAHRALAERLSKASGGLLLTDEAEFQRISDIDHQVQNIYFYVSFSAKR